MTIFFVTNRSFSFLVDVVCSEILRITCRRRVLYIHTFGYTRLAERGQFWRFLVGRLLNSGTDVVCLGASLVADVEPWVAPKRIHLVPNTSGLPEPVSSERSEVERRQVLYLSNLIREKGASDFVGLAIRLSEELPNVQFLLAGSASDLGYLRELQERVSANSAARITLLGAIADESVKAQLLRDAELLVFPSSYPFEAQPLTIIEALSVGTPVIAYDVGGIRDVLSDGSNGFLVPVGDNEGLACRALDILSNSRLRAEMEMNARHSFSSMFSQEQYRLAWARILGDE